MFVVYRFPLVSAVNVVVLPESSKILSVGVGKGGVPSMWYTVEEGEHEAFQVVVIDNIATGYGPSGDVPRVFLGTVNMEGKVCHMFRWSGLPVISQEKAEAIKSLKGDELASEIWDLLGQSQVG